MGLSVVNELLRLEYDARHIVRRLYYLDGGRNARGNVSVTGNDGGNVVGAYVHEAVATGISYDGVRRNISLQLNDMCLSVVGEDVVSGKAHVFKEGALHGHL